jgi:hypothetical protein
MAAALLAVIATGCSGGGEVRGEPEGPVAGVERLTTTTTTTTAPPEEADVSCLPLGPAVTTGTIGDPTVTEASGLVTSTRNPGVLFTHEDSGDAPRVVAMAGDGRLLGTFQLAGAEAIDWEDMAIGPGPEVGASYLYLADTGDNAATRSTMSVYRVPEPDVAVDPRVPVVSTLAAVERFDIAYPDGVARDAEAMLVDPVEGDVVIVSKTLAPVSEVFRFRPEPGAAVALLAPAGTVAIPPGGIPMVTGGAVSADGRWVALRTYDRVLRFARAADVPLEAALTTAACVDALPLQPQGEAVALSPTADSVVTTSEGPSAAIQTQEVGGG